MSEYKRLTLHKVTAVYDYERENLSKGMQYAIYDRLADLEDKIESGQLVELPIDNGDIVFFIRENCYGVIISTGVVTGIFKIDELWKFQVTYKDLMGLSYSYDLDFDDFGKVWFLTKEAAEARLKKL